MTRRGQVPFGGVRSLLLRTQVVPTSARWAEWYRPSVGTSPVADSIPPVSNTDQRSRFDWSLNSNDANYPGAQKTRGPGRATREVVGSIEMLSGIATVCGDLKGHALFTGLCAASLIVAPVTQLVQDRRTDDVHLLSAGIHIP